MIQELLALPTMGGALLAGAAYAALSVFITGPLVAERTIDKSGWPARCARLILTEATADPAANAPSLDCGALLGTIYGKEGEAFCARYGDALSRSVDWLGLIRTHSQDAVRGRVAQDAASDTRCVCAMRTVIDDRRIDFGLHAGSARLVTPLSVRVLDAELIRAVRAPACVERIAR